VFYPASYRSPYQFEETDNANVVARAEVLEKINNGSNAWVVTYPQALFEKVPTQKKLTENTLRVEKGKSYSLDFMNELLMEYGFERVDFVYEPGQFAIRGGILDVFSFANDHPFRLEFFGEEVDSIRTFDPVDQLSIAIHDFFVPDENENPKFGYDIYRGQPLNLSYVNNSLDEIYGKLNYTVTFSTSSLTNSGVAYITPQL
jgi:transcription-repair coupling factor (superfamily II helicase)